MNYKTCENLTIVKHIGIPVLWCLTLLSTIFQLQSTLYSTVTRGTKEI